MGEVIVVFGRGLAGVMERGQNDGRDFVRFADHGPRSTMGMWAWSDQTRTLTAEEAIEAVERERVEAGARGVACSGVDCWCTEWRVRELP